MASTSSLIAPAQVALAEEVAALARSLDPMDCRCHGDPTYDYAVYGEQLAVNNLSAIQKSMPQRGALDAEELVGIFHALESIELETRSTKPRALLRWFMSHLRPIGRGLKNWAIRQLERIPLSWLVMNFADGDSGMAPRVTWSDYSTFADSLIHPPSPQPAKVEHVAGGHVQSGHWLLHSAASSLNHLGLFLQAAADRLDQRQEVTSAE